MESSLSELSFENMLYKMKEAGFVHIVNPKTMNVTKQGLELFNKIERLTYATKPHRRKWYLRGKK